MKSEHTEGSRNAAEIEFWWTVVSNFNIKMSAIDAEIALRTCPRGGLMAFSKEALHTFSGRLKRDGKCVHFHTWVAASAHLLLISDSSSSPLIRDSGTVGSPEISAWVRHFPSTRDYLQPCLGESRKENSISCVNRQRALVLAGCGGLIIWASCISGTKTLLGHRNDLK